VTRTPLWRSNGQRSRSPGHFTHRRVNASASCSGHAWERIGHGKLLLRTCICSEALGASAPTEGEGRGHIVAAACPPTACCYYCYCIEIETTDGGRMIWLTASETNAKPRAIFKSCLCSVKRRWADSAGRCMANGLKSRRRGGADWRIDIRYCRSEQTTQIEIEGDKLRQTDKETEG